MKTVKAILLLLCIVTLTHAQSFWQRSINHYERHNYQAGNANPDISQHANRWMYFANDKGLLEYDGVFWNTYPIHNNAKVKAVKAVGGRIYAGGLGHFGYFSPDSHGILRFTCLSEKFTHSHVINIWKIHTIGSSVYFQSDEGLYYIERGKLRHAHCSQGASYSNVVYGRLYVAGSRGLFTFSGNRFEPITGTDRLSAKVVSIMPYQGKVLIATATGELFYLVNGQLQTVTGPLAQALRGSQISCGATNGHYLAFGTLKNGIILYNTHTRYIEHISTHNGLHNANVLAVALDTNENLWLGLDNGIDCITLGSHLYTLTRQTAVIGTGSTSAIYQGTLYLGTNHGLYTTPADINTNRELVTHEVPEATGQVLCTYVFDDKLFCGGRDFFIMIDHGRVTRLPTRGVWNISRMGNRSDLLLVGTYWGLYTLRKEGGSWKLHNVKGAEISAKTMLVDGMTGTVWVANKEKGLFKLTLSADLTHVVRKKNFNSAQLPIGDNVCISLINNRVVIASRYGLFLYHEASNEIREDQELERQLSGKAAYTFIRQDENRNIWYVCNALLRVCRFDAKTDRYYRNNGEAYLDDQLVDDFENITSCGKGNYLVGVEDGFAYLHLPGNYRNRTAIPLQIRHLYISGVHDSLLYTRSIGNAMQPITIKYRDNSIKIDYCAGNYDKSRTVMYSYRLTGPKNEPWSELSKQHIKEYTDLGEGTYTFYVRTPSAEGSASTVASLTFRILPPWYRSWPAYTLYVLLTLAIIYYGYYRARRYRRYLIASKELELRRQRQHYEEESTLKEHRIEKLQNEKMKIELDSKKSELLMSRMNNVRKNEMLQEIRKTAVSISSSINEENLVSIRRKVVRLIGQIDTNIEHDDDLEAFQDSFDMVHHNFLTLLKKHYPELTHKDRMLCAYIHMNLLSKEIAPLLNISVRGVEISRYRLRKKLHLQEGENLTDFLQKINEENFQEGSPTDHSPEQNPEQESSPDL